jgi:hypothetical protein
MRKVWALLAVAVVGIAAAIASDEITVNASLEVRNGFLQDMRRITNLRIDQAAASSAAGVQLVGTNPVAVATGDLTTPGFALLRNIGGATNVLTITVGVMDASTNFCEVAEMRYSEVALFRVGAGVELYVVADIEGAKMDRLILED